MRMFSVIFGGTVKFVSEMVKSFPAAYERIRNLRRQSQVESTAERAVGELLNDGAWTKRSFATIKARARGMDERELRQLLHRMGAVAYARRSDGAEMWGFPQRNPAQSSEVPRS
jgi:hypothetical protein